MHYRWRDPATGKRAGIMAALLLLAIPVSALRAEKIAIALSQEQDGGAAGKACIYVHQGKAEYRLVKPGQACAAEIVVESHRS